ncbi:Alpha/Beta hydrolase protein [Entophlyctis helioformis]|nr:Alpha/Beta hydrolase protein [Entophlyctis helioformis]
MTTNRTKADDLPKDTAVVEAFRKLGGLPVYTAAYIASDLAAGTIGISYTTSVRDFQRKSKRRFLSQAALSVTPQLQTASVARKFFPTDLGDSGMVAVSPSGAWQLTSRIADKKRYLEIAGAGSFRSIEVTKKHGDFYADDAFGGVGWSADETKFVYIAEREIPDNDSKYVHAMDWGEGYTGKARPVLVVVDLSAVPDQDKPDEPLVTVLAALPVSASQPVLTRAGDKIIFTGIADDPLPFGIKFCYNRRNAIYSVKTDGTDLVKLTPEGRNGRYPRLSPDGASVYYLSNKIGGAHSACSELVCYDLSKSVASTVVPVVQTAIQPSVFPGLFADRLVGNGPWVKLPTGLHLVIQTSWRTQETLVAIHATTGVVTRLTRPLPESPYSWSLLGVTLDGWIVATRSTLSEPASLVLGRLVRIGEPIAWTVVDKPTIPAEIEKGLANIDWKVSSVPGCDPNVEVLLMTPKVARHPRLAEHGATANGAPLVVIPHGGPHGVISTAFSLYSALLASFGFAVAQVNYTGSTGYGEEFVQALIGRIGDLDLSDVNTAAYWASRQPGIDASRVSLFGGSHGGFVTGHLLGLQPDFFKAGILRNPVINVGAMVANSDIPDWCFAEAGIPFDQAAPHLLSPGEYDTMFKKSPASVAHLVKSPVLLMLGAGDRRVPPSDGMRWAQYLLGAGKPITVLMYPETGHALDSFEAERSGFESIASFLFDRFGTPAPAKSASA